MDTYEKKYKEALERARDVYTYYCDDREQLRKIESIFPELKESEDERVRNFIVAVVKAHTCNPMREDALAWLEKQGEQKPIFRIGDYIRNTKTGDEVLIEQLDIATKAYFYVSYDGAAVNHSDIPFSKQDEWELIRQKIIEQNPAWSKEVEAAVNLLKDIAEEQEENHLQYNANNLREAARYLETCRLQNTWKPSDEQMSQLECVATQNKDNILGKELMTLFNDLKKLKR